MKQCFFQVIINEKGREAAPACFATWSRNLSGFFSGNPPGVHPSPGEDQIQPSIWQCHLKQEVMPQKDLWLFLKPIAERAQQTAPDLQCKVNPCCDFSSYM